ncbi:MAG: sugar phosphate nucleotidyltransferase [Syntrophomonadaceae bacterium]|nr:sugar phosphate nucleotidyltransferase [Syntrophomonadaceae bacterium]
MSKDYKKYLIDRERTLREAMEQLDRIAARNVFVVDEKDLLLGSLSDGDIRRAILKGDSIEDKVEKQMNSRPRYVKQGVTSREEQIKKLMLEFGIESVPILNKENAVLEVVNWLEVFNQERDAAYPLQDNRVFILAGGTGSRLEPFTRILPKPLIPIDEQPMVEKIMDKFCYYGFSNFILSLYYKAEMIKLYFSDYEIKSKYYSIDYVQEEFPLGTIGSLYLAADKLQASFFISNSDIFIEADIGKILHFHQGSGAILTIVGCVKNNVIPYGVLNTDGGGYLLSIQEKPEYKNIINTGVYVAEPELIKYIQPGQHQDMTDVIEHILQEGRKISVYPILEEQWFDVGQWLEFERTRKYFEKQS